MVYTVVQAISLYIDSARRVAGTASSDFVINFDKTFVAHDYQFLRLTVMRAVVPYYFLNIESFNNRCVVQEEDGVSTERFVLTLPVGNLDIDQVISNIQSQLNASTIVGFTYTVTRDEPTNIITINHAPAGGANVVTFDYAPTTVAANDLQETNAEIIGFVVTDDNGGLFASDASGNIVVNGPASIGTEQAVYLRIMDDSGEGYEDIGNGFTRSNVLMMAPIVTQPYSNIVFRNINNEFRTILSNKTLSQIHLRLTNERGSILDMRGKNMVISMLLEIIQYKHIPIRSIHVPTDVDVRQTINDPDLRQ